MMNYSSTHTYTTVQIQFDRTADAYFLIIGKDRNGKEDREEFALGIDETVANGIAKLLGIVPIVLQYNS